MAEYSGSPEGFQDESEDVRFPDRALNITPSDDPELQTIEIAGSLLNQFEPRPRERILDYLVHRFGVRE